MGTCKLRAGDRRESVIGYRSPAAKASSGGDGLSNYPAGRPAGRGIRPLPPREKERPGAALAGAKKPVRCLGRSRGPSGAGMGRRRPPMCALPSGGRGCSARREPGRAHGYRGLLPFASPRFRIQFQPPFPRSAGPRAGSASRRARAEGPRLRRLHLRAPPAPAKGTDSSAFLPCASSLFLPLPGAAASFPTSTLPKLFSRSPERGALPQLPEAGSRLLLNFWGSRMSKMEKEIL